MTNKDYKRLTNKYPEPMSHSGWHGERLRELEDCIENGTLVFLPCKVGDKFWVVIDGNKFFGYVRQINIYKTGFGIIDEDYTFWNSDEVYFTEEAAEKALKEIEK